MDHMKVIFRKCDDDIIAFFPEIKVNFGNIMSYMHIGQHCEASYDFYASTKKASESEFLPLLKELEMVYDDVILDVKEKIKYSDLRQKAWC